MLRLKNFSVAFGSSQVFSDLNLQLAQGERLAIIGNNGSGKSTLAFALAGVIPDFVPASVSGEKRCEKPGLIMQDPSSQFFAMTVKEELGEKGSLVAKKFGLLNLLERNVFQLSEGEKQKINLVANLSSSPATLLLDEPTELLDPVEAVRFKQLLGKVRGRTLLWFDKSDPALHRTKKFFLRGHKNPAMPKKRSNVKKDIVLKADISVQRNGFSLNAAFSLREGEKIALIGRNGSGKTTLLKAIAGIERFSGRVELKQALSFAPQNPSHVFFNETAEAEVVEPRNAARLGIGHLLKQNPNRLSKGQQKMLSVAAIQGKGIALLDEPTTWLDPLNSAVMYSFITESKQPMLIATHDKNLLRYCDTIFLIEGGEAKECSSTAANRFFLG